MLLISCFSEKLVLSCVRERGLSLKLNNVELRQDLDLPIYSIFIVNSFRCVVNCLKINRVVTYRAKCLVSVTLNFYRELVSGRKCKISDSKQFEFHFARSISKC